MDTLPKASRKTAPEAAVSRRRFLALASLGGGAAAASAVVSSDAEAATPEERAQSGGYLESEHIRAYYASTRF